MSILACGAEFIISNLSACKNIKLRLWIMVSLLSFSAGINVSLLFVTIWVIPESPWPIRAEDVWFCSKWPALYNHRRRCHSSNISLLFPGIQLLDKCSHFSCMFLVFPTFFFWTIFDFWLLAGCVASDCETKCAVVQWLQGDDAETFIKLKWQMCCPTTGVDIERNVCFDLSTGVKICQFLLTWRSKGNEVQNVISGGFWGFWDWDHLLLDSVVPLKLWVLLMEIF